MNNNFEEIKPISFSKFRSLKDDLINLQQKYVHTAVDYPYTKEFKERVYAEFDEWIDHWELEGFQYKLIFEFQKIIFEPIRKIDKLAIQGILSL